MRQKVSVIVPAYNEEKKINEVLEALVKSKHLHEIICVNDGSTDATADIVKDIKGVRLINLRKNRGKAYAIAAGIRKAAGEIVLFVDADITGLTNKKIQELINPVINGKYDVVIGYRSSRMEATVGVPLSGERVYFRKDLLSHIKKFENKGYGLELYLNYHFKNRRRKMIPLKVFSTPKHEKYPFAIATKRYADTTYQVIKEIMTNENLLLYFIRSYLSYVHVKNRRLGHYFQEARLRIEKDIMTPLKKNL